MIRIWHEKLEKYSDWGYAALRIIVGLIFVVHGSGKLFNIGPYAAGISGTAGFFGGMGLPLPLALAWIVGIIETLGGLMVLLGFLSRLAAAPMALVMLGAGLTVHLKNGFAATNGGYEFVLLLFVCLVFIKIKGSGTELALDKAVLKKEL